METLLDYSQAEARLKAFHQCLSCSSLSMDQDGQALITGIQILYFKFNYLLEDSSTKELVKAEMAQAVRLFIKEHTISFS